MKLAKLATAWCGFLLLAFGLAYVFVTGPMLGLAEIRDESPTAFADLRVMYGALEVVPGALLLAALWKTEYLKPALLLGGSLFGGIVLIRAYSVLLDTAAATEYHLWALGVEIATTALAFAGWRAIRPMRAGG